MAITITTNSPSDITTSSAIIGGSVVGTGPISTISGTCLGLATINNKIVLFVKKNENVDIIYLITSLSPDTYTCVLDILFEGNLNFSLDAPIETLSFYENENVLKVYWVDNNNQPRFINIKDTNKFNNDSFNFINKLQLNEEITIEKLHSGEGEFPSGTVLYAFTYYNKFGQETNIFYISPILSATFTDRGGAPNDITNSVFNIQIKNMDTSFDYVRIYSIIRTSLNSTPLVKKVIDFKTDTSLNLENTIVYDKNYTKPNIINNFSIDEILFLVDSSINETYDIKVLKAPTGGPNPRPFRPFIYKLLSDGTKIECIPYGGILVDSNYNTIIFNSNDYLIIQGLSLVKVYTNSILTNSYNYTSDDTISIINNEIDNYYYEYLLDGSLYTITKSASVNNTLTTVNNVLIETINIPGGVTYEIVTNENTKFYSGIGENKELINIEEFTFRVDGMEITIEDCDIINITSPLGNYTYPPTIANNSINSINTITIQATYIPNGVLITPTIDNNIVTIPFTNHIDSNIKIYASELYEDSLLYTDKNTTGEIIDSTKLLYVGGEEINAKSINQKDNTLFLGNITLKKKLIDSALFPQSTINFNSKFLYTEFSKDTFYGYKPYGIKNSNTKTFKYGDTYRFGIQAQHKSGRWSNVIYVGDFNNNVKPQTIKNTNNVDIFGSKASLLINDTTFLNYLINNDFINLRGVIVYPTIKDRHIIALGVINPTLIHVADKANKIIDNYNSWFFRPIRKVSNIYNGFNAEDTILTTAEFRHYYSIGGAFTKDLQYNNPYIGYASEVQCLRNLPEKLGADSLNKLPNIASDNFYIDLSVFTINSPEIEFSEEIQLLDGENFKFRIIGATVITSNNLELNIQAESPYQPEGGFRRYPYTTRNYNANNASGIFGAVPIWNDRIVKTKHNDESAVVVKDFFIYPWHATRSLNNTPQINNRTALLKNKQFSYFRYSGYNEYLSMNWIPKNGVTNLGIYNRENNNIVKIDSPITNGDKFTYYGHMDKLVSTDKDVLNLLGGYPITLKRTISEKEGIYNLYRSVDLPNESDSELTLPYRVGTELVRIKYNSSTHGVLGLNWSSMNVNNVLPTTDIELQEYIEGVNGNAFFLKENGSSGAFVQRQDLVSLNNNSNILYIGEIYRDNVLNIFGGKTQEALEVHNWIPCGNKVNIIGKSEVTIEYTEGDTYIQRYDTFRSYSESLELTNSVTDTLSFLVETHINLDARYDRNIGTINFNAITPNNFNLLNKVYNQTDNYFSNRILNLDLFNIDNFPNTFTWTKSKTAGELIDSWTNITMASTYDVNGELGEIRTIKLFNDLLVGFQDKGIFNILFNSRILLNTSDGVPIELANSGRVDGVRYFSTMMGTKNSRSTLVTPAGIYFIDDESKAINVFNGQVTMLSDTLGMRTWIKKNHKFVENDSMAIQDNFSTFYDKINKDVYFINNNFALCYSELLQTFVSLFDYNKVPVMFNLNNDFYSISNNRAYIPADTKQRLWRHGVGEYNLFYGKNKGFYIKYLVNPDTTQDKIFDGAELRADAFSLNVDDNILTFIPGAKPFSRIKVDTEYQSANAAIDDINLRQKFRVWKALLPRTTSASSHTFLSNPNKLTGVDRIRNPWAYITFELEGNTDEFNKVLLQDVTFNYTV